MSIRAIITEGFGSFGTVPDVIRMGYSGEAVAPEPEAEAEAPTGGKGDNAARRGIFKPTGLDYRRRKQRTAAVEARVEVAREVAAEVAAEARREFVQPVSLMSLAEVEREIGMLLRKAVRTEEEDVILLTLMAAAAA